MNTAHACSIIRDLIDHRISTRKHPTSEVRIALMTLLSVTYLESEADEEPIGDDADTEITCFTSERRRECCPGCGLLLEGRADFQG